MDAKTYDIKRLFEYFRDLEDLRLNEQVRQKAVADAYYDGYVKAMSDVRQIMRASNYVCNKEDESEGEG